MSSEERIRNLLLENLSLGEARKHLTSDFPLIDNHAIDSLDMLKLISLLEEEFDVEIPDEEIVPENFGTIAKISAFIESQTKT